MCGKNNYLRGIGGKAKGILPFKQQESSKTLLLTSCLYQTEGYNLNVNLNRMLWEHSQN